MKLKEIKKLPITKIEEQKNIVVPKIFKVVKIGELLWHQ